MKQIFYKILLYLLRTLTYTKKGLFWIGGVVMWVWANAFKIYRKTVGFYLYKIFFVIKKQLSRWWVPLDGRWIDWLGKRGTLQIIFFIVAVVVMLPHSQLYTREPNSIPGRGTILYALAGQGDLDFEIDEIVADSIEATQKDTRGWREGAVIVEVPAASGEKIVAAPKEIASISAGGTAVTKPSILPGAELRSVDSPPTVSGSRSKFVTYTVQSGDVIGKIAEKYDLSILTVLWANNLTSRSYIRPGDVLKIPPANGVVHSVKRGDTISKIARVYGAEVGDIIEFNKLQKDGRDIVIGEDLFIVDGEKPQPVYLATTPKYSPLKNVVAPPPSVSAPAGSGYIWPTAAKVITQYYHWRHTAIDVGGPIGTPIYASRTGEVIRSQCGYNGGYGCYIMIDHGGGVQTLYGHNSQLFVSVGDQVSQGQAIAAMGSTGRSTGPHVHFEIRVNGVQQNPLKYTRK